MWQLGLPKPFCEKDIMFVRESLYTDPGALPQVEAEFVDQTGTEHPLLIKADQRTTSTR